MASDLSSRRLFLGHLPSKTVPGTTNQNNNGPDDSGIARQPLCPIPDAARNYLLRTVGPLMGEASPAQVQVGRPFPQAKGKSCNPGHEAFPHSENSRGSAGKLNATPNNREGLLFVLSPAITFDGKDCRDEATNTSASTSCVSATTESPITLSNTKQEMIALPESRAQAPEGVPFQALIQQFAKPPFEEKGCQFWRDGIVQVLMRTGSTNNGQLAAHENADDLCRLGLLESGFLFDQIVLGSAPRFFLQNEKMKGRKQKADEKEAFEAKLFDGMAITKSKSLVTEASLESSVGGGGDLKSGNVCTDTKVPIFGKLIGSPGEKLMMGRVDELRNCSREGDPQIVNKSLHYFEAESLSSECLQICTSPPDIERIEKVQTLLASEQWVGNEALSAHLCEKSLAIGSARREGETGVANLKEAELEIKTLRRANEKLSLCLLGNEKLPHSASFEWKSAQDNVESRELKCAAREVELQKMTAILSDWDTKMQNVDNEWKRENEVLAEELTRAELDANKENCEAGVPLQKFQDGQATLKEPEDLQDALVRATEIAKFWFEDCKSNKENLSIAQGWWTPERSRLVSLIARLQTDVCKQQRETRTTCEKTVICMAEAVDLLALAYEEISVLKENCIQEMKHVAMEIKTLKGDIIAAFKVPVDLKMALQAFIALRHNRMGRLIKVNVSDYGRMAETACEGSTGQSQSSVVGADEVQGLQIGSLQEEAVYFMLCDGEVNSIEVAVKAKESGMQVKDCLAKGEALKAELTSRSNRGQEEERLIDAFNEMAGLALQLQSERDNALKDNADLRDDIVNLRVKLFSLGPKAQEQRNGSGGKMNKLAQAGKDVDDSSLRGSNGFVKQEESSGIVQWQLRVLDAKNDNLGKELLRYGLAERVMEENRGFHAVQTSDSAGERAGSDACCYRQKINALTAQLTIAQKLAAEYGTAATEARQDAQLSMNYVHEKEEEARILGRSVEELESTVYVLQSQLDILNREVDKQHAQKVVLEKELVAVQHQMASMEARIDSYESQTQTALRDLDTAKIELDRVAIEMKNQQIHARTSVGKLQQECAEKDMQLRSCKVHLSELMLGAEKQAKENQHKLKALESMMEHWHMEERKLNPPGVSVGKVVEKLTPNMVEGAGSSSFSCISSGPAQSRSSEVEEDFPAAKKKIKELEGIISSRQKEVFILNTKLAEAESMTHDVVRDLLGLKTDIASYATLLTHQQVQYLAKKVRRRTMEAQRKCSWLGEKKQRQVEALGARISEKLGSGHQTFMPNMTFRRVLHRERR